MDLRSFRKALFKKLNASEDRQSHHVFLWFEVEGKEFRAAKYSHSMKPGQKLPDFILADSAHRMKLSKLELAELVECPLSGEQFLEFWKCRP